MALAENQLFRSADGPAAHARVIVYEGGLKVATFKDETANTLLAKYTPLKNVAGVYEAWADGDADAIHAFTAEAVQLVSGYTVQGNVILKGRLHIDDIALPAGQTLATLKTSLKTGMRELGLDIDGLQGTDLPAIDAT